MADDRARVLLDFVQTRLLLDDGRPLDADTRLLSERVVDSMGVVLLAAFVEERFGVRVDDVDLREGQLETINGILQLIDRRR